MKKPKMQQNEYYHGKFFQFHNSVIGIYLERFVVVIIGCYLYFVFKFLSVEGYFHKNSFHQTNSCSHHAKPFKSQDF